MSKRKRRAGERSTPVQPVNQRQQNQPAAMPLNWRQMRPGILACLGFFLLVCFTVPGLIKWTALATLLVVTGILVFSQGLGKRITWLTAAVTLWVVWNGCSTLYGVAGQFALYEFLKLAIAFGVFILILCLGRGGSRDIGRTTGTAVEVCAALASFLSIDLISTRIFSTIFFYFMGIFTQNFEGLTGIEAGVRITSIFENPNIFAGCAGIGVLVSLGLATTAEGRRERNFHLVCLSVSSLGFLLAFSMGGSATIALAFLVYLALECGARRARLLLLMIETFVVVMVSAFPIYLTSFDVWYDMQPIPFFCMLAGAVVLCVADRFVGRPLADKLAGRDKLVFGLIGLVLAVVAVYAVLAYNVAGSINLEAGETLRRSSYPEAGTYTLTTQASGDLTVVIESQDKQDTMMHTSDVLYSGPAQGASFTVPEGSLVVYFNFTAEQPVQFESATYQGDGGSGSLRLGYKLLPGFMANRLQGLFANENAIQRIVFFEDGMKLFRRSPVIGLGLGVFESSLSSVQSFYYTTKYVHNHYIQTMIDTGIVGLLLFLSVLILAAVAVLRARRKENASPLIPCLGAALVFMAGHGAVEVVFSSNFYLPIALAALGMIDLCCGESLPALPMRKKGRAWLCRGTAVLTAVYAVLLVGNLYARSLFTIPTTYAKMEQAIMLDVFEDNDYMLSYVYSASADEARDAQTNASMEYYLTRLESEESNTIPYYLAESYFNLGRTEKAFEMLERYVDYMAADSEAWQSSFELAIQHSEDSQVFRDGIQTLYQSMQDWNQENMGTVTLEPETETIVQAIINRA